MHHSVKTLRLLVTEDAADAVASLVDFFRLRGFCSEWSRSKPAILAELSVAAHTILVLDRESYCDDASELIRTIRRDHGYEVGIIVLSKAGKIKDRVKGWYDGADACLDRPLDLKELDALVWQLYQRLRAQYGAPGETDSWALHPHGAILQTPNRHRINLTGAENRIMTLLAKTAGKVIERQTLANALALGGAPGDTRRLDVLLSRLRAKVKARSGDELPVKTYRNLGYAFSRDIIIG